MDSSAPLDPTRAAPPAADAPPADVVARLQAELPGRVDVSAAALEAARADRRRIVLPEGEDVRVLRAAEIITRVMSGADASATPDLKVTGDLIEADVYNSGHLLPDLIRSLDEKSIGIADLNVRRPTLDDVFLSLTGRSLRD